MHFLLPFFKWCDSTWMGETIRGSRIYFPIIETFHLLALTILFGAVLVLKSAAVPDHHDEIQPIHQVARDLSPWASWSLVVILVSGVMLFLSEAMKCYASKPFQVKMMFLFAALIYHFTIHRKVSRSEREPRIGLGCIDRRGQCVCSGLASVLAGALSDSYDSGHDLFTCRKMRYSVVRIRSDRLAVRQSHRRARTISR